MESPADKSASNNDDSSNISNGTHNTNKTNKEIREEYFNKLRSWLITVNNYQCYYYKLQQDSFQNYLQVSKDATKVPSNVPNAAPEAPTVGPVQFTGKKCQIPSLWKRFGAEFVDFILLSIIKFVVAYFLVDSIIDIDFAKYNNIFMQDDYNVDYSTAVEMTSELFVIEVTHRIVVCVYEVYFLQGGTFYHGGATVGKFLFDLTVVRVDKLFYIRDQPTTEIAITPGSDLGLKRATLRSFTKNLFFAFVFPLPFLTAPANQNRCAYDVLCGSMVVENLKPLTCPQSELIPLI